MQPYGVSPIKYLQQWDVFDRDFLAVHCVQRDPRRHPHPAQARDVAVAHCPKSNAKLGCGIAPLADLLHEGVRVGLGTDSPASSNIMDMFDEMRTMLFLHRAVERDVSVLDAPDVRAHRDAGRRRGARAGGRASAASSPASAPTSSPSTSRARTSRRSTTRTRRSSTAPTRTTSRSRSSAGASCTATAPTPASTPTPSAATPSAVRREAAGPRAHRRRRGRRPPTPAGGTPPPAHREETV